MIPKVSPKLPKIASLTWNDEVTDTQGVTNSSECMTVGRFRNERVASEQTSCTPSASSAPGVPVLGCERR